MTAQADAGGWTGQVADRIAANGRSGGFLVAFPQYRPVLVRILADALGLDFVDFRASRMAALGWDAAALPLSALDTAIERHCEQTGRGVLLHNAEALLATKGAHERGAWLAGFVTRDWPVPAVVPVAVYGTELPAGSRRICSLDPAVLPPESFLVRLADR